MYKGHTPAMQNTIESQAPPYSPSQPAVPLSTFSQSGMYFQKGTEPPSYPKAPPMDPLLPPSQSPTSNVTIIQHPQVPASSPKNTKLVIFVIIAVVITMVIMEIVRRIVYDE